MSPHDRVPWPPDDIHRMLAEMRADPDSPHWAQTYLQVRTFARRYGDRHGVSRLTYLDDVDDLASDAMEILATPGTLEGFGRGYPTIEGASLRAVFLAWLAIITRRVWTNRIRYYQARVAADSIDCLNAEVPALIDHRADVAERAEQALLLRAAFARLDELRSQSPRNEAKVLRFLLGALYGVPYQAVARQMGCKPSEVRDAVHSVRSELRSLLRRYNVEIPSPLPAPAATPHPPTPGSHPKSSAPRPRRIQQSRAGPKASGRGAPAPVPAGTMRKSATSTQSTPPAYRGMPSGVQRGGAL